MQRADGRGREGASDGIISFGQQVGHHVGWELEAGI